MFLNVEALEKSFDLVRPYTTDFAVTFYKNLFADHPQLQTLFQNTPMDVQEEKLMMSLVLIIQNSRNPAYLASLLKDLGQKHARYGALREHYPVLGRTLLKTLESHLGENWTPEVKQAWVDAYKKIATLMIQGAAEVESGLQSIPTLYQVDRSTVTTISEVTSSELDFAQNESNLEMAEEPNDKVVAMPESISTSHVPQVSQQSEIRAKVVRRTPAHSSRMPVANQGESKPTLEDKNVPSEAGNSGLNLKMLLLGLGILGLLGIGFVITQITNNNEPNQPQESSEKELTVPTP